jgi:hypothetical protein
MNDKILIDRSVAQKALDLYREYFENRSGASFNDLMGACVDVLVALKTALNQQEQEQLDEEQQAVRDLLTTGTGVLFDGKRIDPASIYKQPEQEPVAWRTFDLEGGYDYRTYDDNENYRDEWDRRNPNHKGWVEPLYKNPTPCETCQALARTVLMDQTGYDMAPRREWVGLTDEEIAEMVNYGQHERIPEYTRNFVNAIETKLKEKNT